MPLDPDAEALLSGPAARQPFPREAETDERAAREYLTSRRAASSAVTVAAKELVDHVADVVLPAGRTLRVYRNQADGLVPVLLYLHGGGWVMGSPEMSDALCRRLVSLTGAVVVSLDYRLAPEHPFPAALDDCAEALGWVRENADALGSDAGIVAVGGTSAGGNLAAGLALLVRDRGLPPLAAQLLLYPVLDPRMNTASYETNGTGYSLESNEMRWYWHQYVGADLTDVPIYAAPANAADLAGLAPAVVVTAEYDPLRDEAEDYAARLAAAGVPTRMIRVDGQIHGFLGFVGIMPAADTAAVGIADAATQFWAGVAQQRPGTVT